MKNSIVIMCLMLLSGSNLLYGNDGGQELYRLMSVQDSLGQSVPEFSLPKPGLFDGRKGTAAIYSLVIPGSGQTMLGSPYKGFSFTFLAFGSALTTLISHNNFVASNERLDALEFQYKTSTTWQVSDVLYTSMNEAYSKRLQYKKTRDIFGAISAVIWTLNIVDVLFYTEDEGESVFSSIHIDNTALVLAGGVVDHQQRIQIFVPLE